MVKLINENSDSKRKSVVEARIGRTKQVCVSQEYVPGYGWEDITVYDDNSYESRSQARQDAKDYRDNGFSARVITRRISNPAYAEPEYESKQRTSKRSIKEWDTSSSSYDRVAKSSPRKFAEIIANLVQDMDWQDYVDDTLETTDDMWDDFVDNTYYTLINEPERVIEFIEDSDFSDDGDSLDIINAIKKYYTHEGV